MMVEIFETNIVNKNVAAGMLKILHLSLPDHYFNFDLDDPERILRAETKNCPVKTAAIVKIVSKKHSICWIAD